MPTDQPRDRGICGDAAPLLTPSIFGGHCDLLAGHTGWHEVDGMHWGPNEPAAPTGHEHFIVDEHFSEPVTYIKPLTQADVDAAYQRGLTDGEQHGRTQAVEGWERYRSDVISIAAQHGDERYSQGYALACPGDPIRVVRAHEQAAKDALDRLSRLVGPWEPADPEPRVEAADGGERPAEAVVAGAEAIVVRDPGSHLIAHITPARRWLHLEEVSFDVGIGTEAPIRRADRRPVRRPDDPGALTEEPDLHGKPEDGAQ